MSNNTVYHYCSVETFRKIITNKELWLTDVTKSNDSKELRLAFEKITEQLNSKVNPEIIGTELSNPLVRFRDFFRNFKVTNLLFHVCCFSYDADSLSQWAMYANDATGIAIGFDSTKFFKLTKQCNEIDFDKVEYSVELIPKMVDNKLNQIIDTYSMNKLDNDISWYAEFLDYFFIDVIKMVYSFKNSSFEQEHECRISFNSKPYCKFENGDNSGYEQNFLNKRIDISDGFEIGDIGYYISRGKLVSYRPLHIKDIGSCIKEIIIGPKSLVSENDIKMFLAANNIDFPCYRIKLSKSTYQ